MFTQIALLGQGIDVNHHDSAGETALMLACRDGKMNVVQYLVEQASGTSVIAVAHFSRSLVELFRTCLPSKCEPEYQSRHGAQ